jgi:UDP-N-acetylglucosamine--N-acetylmuramyl-(pentapeptide) pyrophosphoryl-undecaprenol N-acetylglucosamine transferase
VILLAGGGTGGHVFPLIALAEELAGKSEVRFVGTKKGLEARVVPERGFRLETLDVEPLKGRSILASARGGMVAGAAVIKAIAMVARLKPRLTVSVGGYAAGPIGLASATLNVPLALLEPNRVTGFTQKLLGPLAKRIYVAFPEASKSKKARPFGIPLRKGFSPSPSPPRGDRPLKILITGGSQGAEFLNQTMPEVISLLTTKVSVIHQCGRDRGAEVSARYGSRSDVQVVEFLDDLAAKLAWADLVVGRAGASALGEICAVGRASILIPYPFAADDHQAANAETLEKAGAAMWMRQSEATVARLVRAIDGLSDEARVRMADAARKRGVPDAAKRIADDLLELAGVTSQHAEGRA